MAFSEFKYLHAARRGLQSLAAAGVTDLELAIRIDQVMQGSRPLPGKQHVVYFRQHFFVFTVSLGEPRRLILATIERQPW